jgi:hypothetical protein
MPMRGVHTGGIGGPEEDTSEPHGWEPSMNHLCFHAEHGPHQCHCGIGKDHTTAEYRAWCDERGLTPLDSEIG